MRRAPWCALLCCVAAPVAAQERAVTFEEPQPVAVTGFAVGRADYDRVARSNSFTAGKIGVSLFKPVGDVYLFAQLTTALEGTETSTEIDNLLVSWTPHRANQWTLAFGRFDAPIGFERDDEPLNLIATNSFNFEFARPGKLTGVQLHYTASPRAEVWAVAANGWDAAVDNNRGKTALLRAQVIPIPWVTVGVTGVYGPERDSTDANQRSLLSGDVTIDRGRLIVGAEVNLGREQRARRDLQQYRAHPLSRAPDRPASGCPGGLVVAAVLSRRRRGAPRLGYEGRARAGVRLLAEEASCSTTSDAPTFASSGWSRVCSRRSASHTCSGH